jgi:hypothetical protein
LSAASTPLAVALLGAAVLLLSASVVAGRVAWRGRRANRGWTVCWVLAAAAMVAGMATSGFTPLPPGKFNILLLAGAYSLLTAVAAAWLLVRVRAARGGGGDLPLGEPVSLMAAVLSGLCAWAALGLRVLW